MSTIKQLKEYGKQYIVSPQVEAILCSLLNINSFKLLDCMENVISEDVESKFKEKILKVYNTRKITSAIEYINFCDLHFKINDNVLLPHFETQEVVMKTIEYIEKLFSGKGNLIDIGCGSGVIGLTIKNKYMIVLEIGDYQKKSVISLVNKYLKDTIIKTLESRKGFEKSIYIFGGFKEEDF